MRFVTYVGLLLFAPGPTWADAPVRTFAVVIGSNAAPDAQTEPLNYADDDAGRWGELLAGMADEVTLLTRFDPASAALYGRGLVPANPTRANVEAALQQTAQRVESAQRAGTDTRLFLVFVGHGVLGPDRMGSLIFEDAPMTRTALTALLAPLNRFSTHRTHLVIDACNAWFMVHDRGEGDGAGATARLKTWKDDRSGETWERETERALHEPMPDRLGLILATSGAQQSHETQALSGGVFSHEVRSALLGAADADGDGRVTYDELNAFLLAAGASIQHTQAPSVYVRPPADSGAEPIIALSDFRSAAWLALPAGLYGHFRLVDARGLPYAEVNRAGDGPGTRIALLDRGQGAYELNRKRPGESADVAIVPVGRGQAVDVAALSFEPPQKQAARGLLDDAYRQGLFATPYGLGVVNLVRTMGAEAAPRALSAAPKPGLPVRADAGFLVAGAARPGEAVDAVSLGATVGVGVELGARLLAGLRVQYDQAAVGRGHMRHFVAGAASRLRIAGGEWAALDLDGLLGLDMVEGTRKVDGRSDGQFDPDNPTVQLQVVLAGPLSRHFGWRTFVGYGVTTGVRLVFDEDDREAGWLHRPMGGLGLEVLP